MESRSNFLHSNNLLNKELSKSKPKCKSHNNH